MKKNKIVSYLLTIISCAVVFFPFYWLIVTSLQPLEVLYQWPPDFLPVNNPITTYLDFLRNSEVAGWILNSVLVSGVATLVSTILGVFGAYSISRFKYRGKVAFIFLILLTQMMPGAFLVIPIYFVFAQMGLVNTLFSLMLIYVALTTPISVWFLKGFFDSIPKEIEEAAIIDGSSRLGLLFRVILPLMSPGIVATATWCFIISYNEYVFAYTLINSNKLWVVSIGIASFIGEYYTDWSQIMTASIIVTVPIVILFMVFQRYLVSGLTAGSVKG